MIKCFHGKWNVTASLRLVMIALYGTKSFVRPLRVPYTSKQNHHRSLASASSLPAMFLKGVSDIGLTTENSFLEYLDAEETEGKQQHTPRQIYKTHYTNVLPEPVPTPYMIMASESCAKAIGLAPTEFRTLKFVKAFAGNELLPGLDQPYSSNYGCHCYSSWFGQLGDGRAMALGEVLGESGERYELQLKGCGRSPYSRGFDGRAVLRSSIREFLVSEAMFHLGVQTTRALSVVGTGQNVRRPWYSVDSKQMIESGGSKISRFAPNMMISEPGAILCRVSKSFLRFAQLELFAIREEYAELAQLANHVCLREFPHLLSTPDRPVTNTEEAMKMFTKEDLKAPGSPQRYVDLFREVAHNNAALVSDWQRVGYTQGNMNSDNTLLAGRTLDYGPFGWMEKYDPMYQPFTSDSDRKFAFIRQPHAMGVNVAVLGETTIIPLIRYSCADPTGPEAEGYIQQVKSIISKEYAQFFWTAYRDVIRRKLGLQHKVHDKDLAMTLWTDLERLMAKSNVDFTIFFRLLSSAASQETCGDALMVLEPSFYESCFTKMVSQRSASKISNVMDVVAALESDEDLEQQVQAEVERRRRTEQDREKDEEIDMWFSWLDRYLAIVKSETRSAEERIAEQNRANPKYVLRNWMAILAYEKAADGDYTVVRELQDLLTDPYDLIEKPRSVQDKWFVKKPCWAEGMPGAEFMSCSS